MNLTKILRQTKTEMSQVQRQVGDTQAVLKSLEGRQDELQRIEQAIAGLKRAMGMRRRRRRDREDDPGKYEPAYYYAGEIKEEDIVACDGFRAALKRRCSDCTRYAPVLMSYEQTYDSPEGDVWEKTAFYICCGKIHELKKVTQRERF